MEKHEGQDVAAKEELVSSWQDLRGRVALMDEHKWETIAGGRHAEVVALDGGMDAFTGLSCVKTEDHHGEDFMTVCKGTTAVSTAEATHQSSEVAQQSLLDSPKSTHDKVCFDDEDAEVVTPRNPPPMQFEEGGCVHPSRPQEAVEAVPDLDDDSEAEHEASSLTGSDHEYAFVFEKPLATDTLMQESPHTGRRPAWKSPEAPRRAALSPPPLPPPPLTPRDALLSPLVPNHPPAIPAPLAADSAAAQQDDSTQDSTGPPSAAGEIAATLGDSNSATPMEADSTAEETTEQIAKWEKTGAPDLKAEKHATYTETTEREYERVPLDQDERTADNAQKERHGTAIERAAGQDRADNTVAPERTRESAAEARQRSLDAVGVIPGGRAAFGAPPPARPAAPGRLALVQPPRVAEGRGAIGAPAAAGGGRSAAAAAAAPGLCGGISPRLRAQQMAAARRSAAAEWRPFLRPTMWRMETRLVPGDMLDSYDRLWHGGAGVVASQS